MAAVMNPSRPLQAWQAWYAQNTVLAGALLASLALHAVLLTIRFVAPQVFDVKAQDPGIEVVLVNTRSERRPSKAELLAQANLEGGGDKDRGRATTPLPNVGVERAGDALEEARRRLEQLDAEQRKLLSSLMRNVNTTAPDPRKSPTLKPNDTPSMQTDETTLALARQAAIVEARIQAEYKRPKTHILGASARDFVAAMYYDSFRQRVERWGNMNYPEAARGKIYGAVQLTVVVDRDGQIVELKIDKSSGSKVLDEAAINIVRRAQPFGRFSDRMRAEMDLLSITRTMVFTNDTLEARS
jgi:protein TonB